MHTLISVLLGSVLMASNVSNYHVHGHVSDLKEGTKLYLKLVGPPQHCIDSAVVKNGIYEFKGNAPASPQWAVISLKGRFSSVADFYIEKGDIYISGDSYHSVAKGTKTNDEYVVFNRDISSLYEKQSGLHITLATAEGLKKDSAARELKLVNKKIEIAEYKYLSTYPASVISVRLLKYMSRNMSGHQLDEALTSLDKSLQNDTDVLEMKRYAKELLSCAVGTKAVDFSLTTVDGKNFRLSDMKGKYVLLDFWASWCAPCRASLPAVARLYEKYKNKNFEVVGVSLDRNTASWEKALKEEKCTWVQVCDAKGHVVPLYAVSAIPLTVLVSPQGEIIGRFVHVDDTLSRKLSDIFDK